MRILKARHGFVYDCGKYYTAEKRGGGHPRAVFSPQLGGEANARFREYLHKRNIDHNSGGKAKRGAEKARICLLGEKSYDAAEACGEPGEKRQAESDENIVRKHASALSFERRLLLGYPEYKHKPENLINNIRHPQQRLRIKLRIIVESLKDHDKRKINAGKNNA